MNNPSIISSKKLLMRLESLATKDTFWAFSISPRIIYEDPSIIAFSFS